MSFREPSSEFSVRPWAVEGPRAASRPTLRDVARRLGVSVATVSNAYNRPDQLSEDLRGRILAAARDLGYQGPDPLARSLRRGRTGVLGVVYDAPLEYAFADPAAALFLGSVTRAVQDHDLNVLLLALVALACVWLVTEPLRTRTPDDPDAPERARLGAERDRLYAEIAALTDETRRPDLERRAALALRGLDALPPAPRARRGTRTLALALLAHPQVRQAGRAV